MGECGTAGQHMQAVVAQALTACLFADDLRPGHPWSARVTAGSMAPAALASEDSPGRLAAEPHCARTLNPAPPQRPPGREPARSGRQRPSPRKACRSAAAPVPHQPTVAATARHENPPSRAPSSSMPRPAARTSRSRKPHPTYAARMYFAGFQMRRLVAVPRNADSAADRALTARLAERGLTGSTARYERWRRAGLLPRHERRGAGRGRGSVSALSPATVEVAAALRYVSSQMRHRVLRVSRLPPGADAV
jgi:hypothetical protein